ncbi:MULTISPECIES: serine hydrolase [unclassified Moorena]|uniref:serine hydrolase n=1 Tax=unclassified Moorena TaxID=2683338 RepID=UPI0025CC0331|nr:MULTISPECIES: serine hydrolase [unclassified Moorena]
MYRLKSVMKLAAHQMSGISAEIDAYLKAHHEIGWFSGAVIVLKAGKTMFTRGYGMASLEYQLPNTPQTRFRLGSVTKQFTAAAILQLQDLGLVDVHAPVSTYLPDYPHGNRITLHHLLTHTAGIPNLTSFQDKTQWMAKPTTLEELIARFQDLPLEFEPGKEFRYSNSGYVLLTQVIETVSGQSYGNYLKEHLLQPLGMENTGYEYPLAVIDGLANGYQFTDDGYLKAEYINMFVPQGAGGLYSTLEDLARWNQFLFDHGVGDETILRDKAIATMTSPLVPMNPDETPHLFYGYGLVINKQPKHQRIGHGGRINGFVTNLEYYPDQDVSVAVLSNVQTANIEQISQDLAAIVFGEPYSKPTVSEVDPSVYEGYIGTYQVAPEFQVTITTQANQLRIQGTGQSIFNLYPTSETEFFTWVIDLRVVFNQGSDGTVESVTLLQNGQETVAPRVD